MSAGKFVVMYVIGSLGNGRAGTERSLLTLASSLDRARFEPIIVSLQDCEFIRAGDAQVETHCLDLNRMFTPNFLRQRAKLAVLMSSRNVAVVQTFFTEAHLVGGYAARRAQVPVIISSRRNLGYGYGWKERCYLHLANRYPHRFLANSEAVADSIACLEHLPRDRFDVIYNGVDLAPVLPGSRPARPIVIMTANLRPIKAVDTLIDAARIVSVSRTDVAFRIIGDGPERGRLTARAESLGVGGQVQFLGSLNDVSAEIASASIGVLTSRSEGFSNSILEYMCRGLPVIATDVGGNREVIDDGRTGCLIPVDNPAALAEKILYLVNHPQIAGEMGRQGRALVMEKFSLQSMVRNHEDYYCRLLAAAGR